MRRRSRWDRKLRENGTFEYFDCTGLIRERSAMLVSWPVAHDRSSFSCTFLPSLTPKISQIYLKNASSVSGFPAARRVHSAEEERAAPRRAVRCLSRHGARRLLRRPHTTAGPRAGGRREASADEHPMQGQCAAVPAADGKYRAGSGVGLVRHRVSGELPERVAAHPAEDLEALLPVQRG